MANLGSFLRLGWVGLGWEGGEGKHVRRTRTAVLLSLPHTAQTECMWRGGAQRRCSQLLWAQGGLPLAHSLHTGQEAVLRTEVRIASLREKSPTFPFTHNPRGPETWKRQETRVENTQSHPPPFPPSHNSHHPGRSRCQARMWSRPERMKTSHIRTVWPGGRQPPVFTEHWNVTSAAELKFLF